MLLLARSLLARFSTLLLASALAAPILGLDLSRSMKQYTHRIWGQEEGLFQPTIYSILQTSDGFLWLGTQDSLLRFDGIHFREFADSASPLHGSLVRALVEDREGNLWAGTLGSGIVRIDRNGLAKTYSTKNGLPSDSVFCLSRGSDGSVWACTTEGLVRIERDQIRVFTNADGLASKRIRTTCEANDGTRWVAGLEPGLSRGRDGHFAPYATARLAPGESVIALDCASDGSVWVGTSAGVKRLTGEPRFFSTKNGLPDNEVSALIEGKDGTLWVGTNDGVSRIYNGEVSVYTTRDGLSHSQVLALCLDREGTLWAGTKNGLDQFTDGKVTPYTTSEGLLSNDTGPVLEDNAGHLWIGTLSHGLNTFDGRRFRALTTREGLVSNSILSLALGASGDLWVGTKAGVNRIRDGAIAASYTARDGLIGGEVRSLFVDARGTLWAGTNKALVHLEGSRFVGSTPSLRPAGDSVIAVSGGHTVRLFASLDEPGLYVMRDNRLAPYPIASTHPVDCFLLDPARHIMWMGTLGSGLLRWKNDVISHVYVKDGLYDNRIYSILRDDGANLWLASSKGIFRLSEGELEDFAEGKTKNVTSLPFSTGQLRFECRAGVQPAACRTRDGRLWFSTTSGLVVLDPNNLHNNRVPPPVAIASILVDGKRLGRDSVPHLQPRQTNNVEIRYAGLSFISPEKVTFRYRLDPYERSWVDAGTRREAFYTNLPPRSFDFQVEARNADGVWSQHPASLRFVVDPKLYQRTWFFPVMAALAGLLVFLGYRLRIRRLRYRFSLVLAERNRIARELHDTLLQGLSGITMQLQALWMGLPASPERQSLGEIIQDAGKCAAEARRSLWGLRSQGRQPEEFSEKLSNLAREAVSGKPLSLSLELERVSLSEHPDAEYQLLRIAQEAIANTSKHAAASRVMVRVRVRFRTLLLEIEDDGIGLMNFAATESGHFGIEGMRERAREIGADLAITDAPGQGTLISVSLPLARDFQQPAGNVEVVDAHQRK